jgi:methylmalonyl-CoA/ethylmalonyl-CoA epimerase
MSSTSSTGLVARRIDHVGVLVADMAAATARFQVELGLVDDGVWRDPDGRFELRYLTAGDTTLQLVLPLGPGPLQDALEARGEGLHHVCFVVDELDAVIAGGRPLVAPPYLSGRAARVCFLADRIHGVTIELTEPPR